jgi:hypothetical protein
VELEMKYQHGQLRNEHDMTLHLSAYSQKQEVRWEEYGPFAALACLLLALLVKFVG